MSFPDRQPMIRQPVEVQPEREHFPFGPEFQLSLFRLLLDDSGFAHAMAPHLDPTYFESEALAWSWSFCLRYQQQYGGMPSSRVLLEQARGLDLRIRPLYMATIDMVSQASLREEQWVRDQVLEFVRRNVFVRAFREARTLYNQGRTAAAYDLMQEQMGRIHAVSWESVDREWVCSNLGVRHSARLGSEGRSDTIPTGLRWLDRIMEGGLALGEMGIWIAYPKHGKTTLLVTHGVAAVRLGYKNVLHCVFEGSRAQVVNRYDTAFSEELYSKVKTGDMDNKRYELLLSEYKMLAQKLVVRAFVDRWDYSVLDVHEEVRALKRESGWEPQLIIVDYGDLLRGREKHYNSETEKQRAAFRDLKSLANRGYGLWTASQAQRPKEGDEERAHFLRSRNIADAYDKVRVADYLGSINATRQEKLARIARLLAELYRDNEAESTTVVRADFSRMLIREEPGLVSPSMMEEESSKLGQVPRQMVAPV